MMEGGGWRLEGGGERMIYIQCFGCVVNRLAYHLWVFTLTWCCVTFQDFQEVVFSYLDHLSCFCLLVHQIRDASFHIKGSVES